MTPAPRTSPASRPQPGPAAAPTCAHAGAFEILDACHRHILEKLEVLQGVAAGLERQGAFAVEHLADLCDVLTTLDTAIPVHTEDEEQTLFPELRRRPEFAGAGGTPMDCMEQDHVGHRRLMAGLKRAVMKRDAGAAASAARRIVAEYRDHIAKEDQILFPMARRMLGDPAVLDRMTEEMRQHRRDAGLLDC